MRFLHTADWQIGMKASHVGKAGELVREQRLKTARRVVEEAGKARVEFIILSGDTFENNAVDRLSIQKTADLLAEAGVPVYLIPGNHDPLAPGSVWEHPVWREHPSVHVLKEKAPVNVPGGVLFPCPILEKYSRKDPTGWIPVRNSTDIRIGIAHGTMEGMHQEETNHPISRDAAQRLGLDYLALGHWHSVATFPGQDGTVRMAYSGTPEPTGFGERESGYALIVEIERTDAVPKIEAVQTGALRWQAIELGLRGAGELASLRREIEAIQNPSAVLLKVTLDGVMRPEDRAELDRIREIVFSRFLYGNVDASRLRPSPEDERWIDMLPSGLVRQVGERLRQLADPAFTGPRPEGAAQEVASRALIELFALLSEARQ